MAGNDVALPLGFAPIEAGDSTRAVVGETGPTGLYDLLGEKSIPIFEGMLDGEAVLEGHFGAKKVADNISIWLPGVLKVDPWPEVGMNQFEWYVPVDAGNHSYLQVLGRMTKNKEEADAFRKEVDEKWIDLALDGFNDDDVWAREATEEFYGDSDRGWVEERLFETTWQSSNGESWRASTIEAFSVSENLRGSRRHGALRRPPVDTESSRSRVCWSASRTRQTPSTTPTGSMPRSGPPSPTPALQRSRRSVCTRSSRCTSCSLAIRKLRK